LSLRNFFFLSLSFSFSRKKNICEFLLIEHDFFFLSPNLEIAVVISQ
jgi:hypothetical protein